MKVVLFINDLGSGGAEHQLVGLANGLVDAGYKVVISTFGDGKDHYSYSSKIERHRIAPRKNKIAKLLAIWKYFLTVDAEWVISFCQRQNLLCLGPLCFRSRKRIRIIAGERNATIGKISWEERLLLSLLYKRVDYIVANSHTQRKHIEQLKPNYRGKAITIINYTDLHEYSFVSYPDEEKLRIGVFSRYSEQKNCLRFVDAIKQVSESTDQKFVVEWYGNKYFRDGSLEKQYVLMEKKIQDLGVEDHIKLNEQVTDVANIMNGFAAICSPSLYEGFSNSISEAICCGRPVLASDVSDNYMMVNDYVNGYLFDPTSTESICNAFLRFFQLSYEDKCTMSSQSRKIAESLFDYNRFINAYVSLLES